MSRIQKVVAGMLASVVFVVLVLVVTLVWFDWNHLKPLINEKATQALGRPFAIHGDLRVDWRRESSQPGWRAWLPWPRVSAEQLVLANAPWAKADSLATFERVEFSLAPLPLLEQRLAIRHVQLTQPAVNLERQPDGQANWQFTLPDQGGAPTPWRLDIDEIGFDQGRLSLADQVLKADLELTVDLLGQPIPYAELADLNAPPQVDAVTADSRQVQRVDAVGPPMPVPPDYVFGWQAQGRYKGQALKGEGKLGGTLALSDPRQPFPLQLQLQVGASKVALKGTLTDLRDIGALDLQLSLSGASMADLYPLLGVTLPDTPAYATQGHLLARLKNPGGAVFEYRDFSGQVGHSDLHGSIVYSAGSPRPQLQGQLTSRLLRMADLGPLIGVPDGAAPLVNNQDAPSRRVGKVLPAQEFRTDRWRDMDADIQLSAEKIQHGGALPLADLSVHLVLDDGLLILDPVRFSMAGGSFNAKIRLDGRTELMSGTIDASARHLRLKQLFSDVSAMQKALGEMNADAVLSGSGNSIAALLGSATGHARLLVNNGLISRGLMEIAGLNVGNYVVSKLFGDDEVKINCAAADLQMKSGVASPQLFIFDTENALIRIDGSADFKTETLDLDISPSSKGFRLFSLRSPLYVRGSFADPQAGVKALPLAARGVGMVALGVLLTPAAGLLALIGPSAAEDNGCGALLKQMSVPARPAAGKSR